MTRSGKPRTDRMDEAMEALAGLGLPIFAGREYIEKLSALRKADPAAARRVERALEPVLRERTFPRRNMPWHDTSEGTKARLALLTQNPHFEEDVRLIRGIFGIPDGQIRGQEDSLLWKEVEAVVGPESVGRVAAAQLALGWLQAHREALLGQPPPDPEAPAGISRKGPADALSPSLRRSAEESARLVLDSPRVPAWLRKPPRGTGRYARLPLPIDKAVGRLVERHRLPWHVASRLTLYLLTLDEEWVSGLEQVEVVVESIDWGSGRDPDAFAVTVRGLDEYVTKEDWEQVWEKRVKPRQQELWEARGMRSQGRRGLDVARLEEALPLYRQMVARNLRMPQVIEMAGGDADQETVRRIMTDLKTLLQPWG